VSVERRRGEHRRYIVRPLFEREMKRVYEWMTDDHVTWKQVM
jgi:hypothetical protein